MELLIKAILMVCLLRFLLSLMKILDSSILVRFWLFSVEYLLPVRCFHPPPLVSFKPRSCWYRTFSCWAIFCNAVLLWLTHCFVQLLNPRRIQSWVALSLLDALSCLAPSTAWWTWIHLRLKCDQETLAECHVQLCGIFGRDFGTRCTVVLMWSFQACTCQMRICLPSCRNALRKARAPWILVFQVLMMCKSSA